MTNNLEPTKMGRPTKLTPELIEKAKGYLLSCVDDIEGKKVNLPSVEGFALWLQVSDDTLYEWAKTNDYFSDTLAIIKREQKSRLVNSGLAGTYNSTIAKLMLSSNHGMVEKTASELTGKDGGPIQTESKLSDDEYNRIINGVAERRKEDTGSEKSI